MKKIFNYFTCPHVFPNNLCQFFLLISFRSNRFSIFSYFCFIYLFDSYFLLICLNHLSLFPLVVPVCLLLLNFPLCIQFLIIFYWVTIYIHLSVIISAIFFFVSFYLFNMGNTRDSTLLLVSQ